MICNILKYVFFSRFFHDTAATTTLWNENTIYSKTQVMGWGDWQLGNYGGSISTLKYYENQKNMIKKIKK